MTAKKRKFWNIPPEEEQTGLLLWFQILQKHYLKLFGANAIAVLSLLPCAYFIYLLMMLLAAYFLTGLTLFGYQQIAMLELPFGTQLKNAALLIFAGKLRAFFAIAVWVGMLLVPVIYYGLAAYILLAGWVAIGVMTANVIFAPVFSRLFLTGEPE